MRILISAALLLASAGVIAAKPRPTPVWPELGVETSIAFPRRNIDNFEADGNRGVWIKDRRHRWYYADFIGSCQGLNFVQGIGFDTRGSTYFDRTSKILLEGEVCALRSLVTAEKPLPRKEREKLRKARAAVAEPGK